MPYFEQLPYPRRYNSLRLLGYDYASTKKLCAITLVSDMRRPIFADMPLAKAILKSLLSAETLARMHLRAFTLMPDHLHCLAGVRKSTFDISDLIGKFKSFTTQLYWKRSHEVFASAQINLPSQCVSESRDRACPELLTALSNGTATLRPEIVKLNNWPCVQPVSFQKKNLWQARFFDHVIRNDEDLRENLEYIAMNPVKAGYVTRPWFYPYTGFLE